MFYRFAKLRVHVYFENDQIDIDQCNGHRINEHLYLRALNLFIRVFLWSSIQGNIHTSIKNRFIHCKYFRCLTNSVSSSSIPLSTHRNISQGNFVSRNYLSHFRNNLSASFPPCLPKQIFTNSLQIGEAEENRQTTCTSRKSAKYSILHSLIVIRMSRGHKRRGRVNCFL